MEAFRDFRRHHSEGGRIVNGPAFALPSQFAEIIIVNVLEVFANLIVSSALYLDDY
jgi:hypothetical protein